MADKIVISQLEAKRAEIAGDIQKSEKILTQLRKDLATIDGALRLFDPKINPKTIGPRPKRAPGVLKHGVFCRATLDVLRRAEKPMTAREIAAQVALEHGLETSPDLMVKCAAKVRTVCLNHKAELIGARSLDGTRWRAR